MEFSAIVDQLAGHFNCPGGSIPPLATNVFQLVTRQKCRFSAGASDPSDKLVTTATKIACDEGKTNSIAS